MKPKLQFLLILILSLFLNSPPFAQCPGDTVGNCDTLFVETENGRIQPNTSVVRHVWGYHDEDLAGIKIPLRFKTNQMAVTLDSVRLHPDISSANIKDTFRDTVGDGSKGKITILLIWLSGQLNAGVDTFVTLYFTTGPTWDPAIYNPIDTFRAQSGAGLSFTDVIANDITPHYDPPGNLDVRNENRGHPTGKPTAFHLSQNYPNPFNAETVIVFALPRSSDVKIGIFNILGQKVRDLVDERVSAGYKKVVWNGKNNEGKVVASGVYLYQLKAGTFTEAKRMILLK